MSQQTNNLSFIVSRLFDYLNGDENVVKYRRALFSREPNTEDANFIGYIIGSSSDGLLFKKSDLDIMVAFKTYHVHDVKSNNWKKSGSYLSALYIPVSSYAHLKVNTIFPGAINELIQNSAVFYDGTILLSSSQFLKYISYVIDNSNTVGPSTVGVFDCGRTRDFVRSFHCQTWPTVADEWVYRSRKYSWPNQK